MLYRDPSNGGLRDRLASVLCSLHLWDVGERDEWQQ